MRRFLLSALALVSASTAVPAAAECLPLSAAPASGLPVKDYQWGNDSGPLLETFVELPYRGERIPALQGIDLSGAQPPSETDYDEIARCGAQFAFVKFLTMDKRTRTVSSAVYKAHLAALRARGIVVVPYFWLAPAKLKLADYSVVDDAMLIAARELGRRTADQELNGYEKEVGEKVTRRSFGGLRGTLMSVDAEVKPSDDYLPHHEKEKANYGRYYGALLRGWVDGAKARYPDAQIVLYSAPGAYVEYIAQAEAVDYAKLYGLPVWLARPQATAGDVEVTNAEVDATRNGRGIVKPGASWTQRICLSSNFNKCIFQQYSQRGMFGLKFPAKQSVAACKGTHFAHPCWPSHIDLNRMYPAIYRTNDSTKLVTRAYDPRLSKASAGGLPHEEASFAVFAANDDQVTAAARAGLATLAARYAQVHGSAVLATLTRPVSDREGAMSQRRVTALESALAAAGIPLGRIAISVTTSPPAPGALEPPVLFDLIR
jgi:hypothetical protein